MDKKQQLQENQYKFPYHYIPEWSDRFTQVQVMRWGYEYASYMEFVVNLLRSKYPAKNLADVGCGDGRLVYEVTKNLPKVKVVGIDYSEQAVALARVFNPGTSFYVGDITNPLFKMGTFDTVTLVETLEHIPPETIKRFVSGLSRLLNVGGRLIVTVPSANIPVSKKHYQHFTLKSLEETLSPDFVLEKHYFVNSTSLKETIIKKLLHNRIYSLNKNKISNFLYNYYKKHLFQAGEKDSRRVIGIFRKK